MCYMGSQLPTIKGAQPPVFGSCLLWRNSWMNEAATWYGSRPRPRPHCVRQEPSSPEKGAQQPPSFRPMSIVATSPISAAAELLLGKIIINQNLKNWPRWGAYKAPQILAGGEEARCSLHKYLPAVGPQTLALAFTFCGLSHAFLDLGSFVVCTPS